MTPDQTIRLLLASAAIPRLPEEGALPRKAERIAWLRETAAALREAQRAMDERCAAAAGTLGEEEFDRLFEAEQARVDAIRAELDAVAKEDRWPKHLYFGCV